MDYYYSEAEFEELKVFCECLPVEIPTCVETIYFPTIYLSQALVFYFVDKFDKEYIFLSNTDEQGWAPIEVRYFPAGFFNPYAGKFRVFFTSVIEPKSERLYFRAPMGLYPCLDLKVIDTVFTNVNNIDNFYTDLKKYYCCCERICPPKKPDCSNPETIIIPN
jgi:hypothetical protein